MNEAYYPKENNLGQHCLYWGLGKLATSCSYPKYELQGRKTCQGIIDDVCLHIKEGRPITNPVTALLLAGINIQIPNSSLLPPGQIE